MARVVAVSEIASGIYGRAELTASGFENTLILTIVGFIVRTDDFWHKIYALAHR